MLPFGCVPFVDEPHNVGRLPGLVLLTFELNPAIRPHTRVVARTRCCPKRCLRGMMTGNSFIEPVTPRQHPSHRRHVDPTGGR